MEMQELAKRTRAWACYDCGKCTATCPISRAGAPLSPRRHVLATVLGHQDAINGDSGLASCLSCSLCDFRCPAEVRYTDLVLELKQLTFGQGAEPECPHGGALQSAMRMMAKGGMEQQRLEWLTDDLSTEPSKGKVFLWTGCTMYYDAFFPEHDLKSLDGTRAAVKVLNALGMTPVVSAEERCCGHDLLWNGDRSSFEALAEHNTQLVADSGAKLLVSGCAECVRTWRKDYTPFLKAPVQILHISELVAEHLDEIAFAGNGTLRVTYQDPCRLGRHLGVFDPPRQVLEAIPGIELEEMARSGPRAICCAGGPWSSCDRYAKQIQVARLREARATAAEVMVTSCPKCQVHFRCAMQDPKLADEITIEMRDLAELVADALSG
jgi:Fe-S oxidoreductase